MATRIATIGRCNGQIVVVIDVAQIAGHIGMPVGQREPGRAVIECSDRPAGCGMARRTICKCKCGPGRRMHGIFGLLPGGQMASGVSAIGRRNC